MNVSARITVFIIFNSIFCFIHTTPIAFRSYSINTPRELSGNIDLLYTTTAHSTYGSLSVAVAGGNSFNPHQITHCLFGNLTTSENCCPQINISGSQVVNRGAQDWLADYFGLPTDFQSVVRFDPHIRSILVDFLGFWQLSCLSKKLSIRLHAPLAWGQWNLNMQEMVSDDGDANYNAGYFSSKLVKRAQLTEDFTSFMAGQTPEFQLAYLATSTAQPFIIFNPLCVNRIINDDRNMAKLADLRIIAQYAPWLTQHARLNVGIVGAIPTGNELNTRTVFQPIVGNGHYWELGGAANFYYAFKHSQDQLSFYSLYFDVQATHLFANNQWRSFDLCKQQNSKYMLAQKLGPNAQSPNRLGGSADAGFEFANEYTSVANLTQRCLKVSIPVQVEATAMLNGTRDTFNWNLGYNFWYRGCEKYGAIACDACPPSHCNNCPNVISSCIPANTWALKGDASVFGFELSTDVPLIALAATQSKATLQSGTNNFVGDDPTMGGINGILPSDNPGIDNPVAAISNNGDPVLDFVLFDQIYTSSPPLFLQESDINFASNRNKGLTHSIFGSVNYIWTMKKNWTPYIGVGAQAEFAPHDSNNNCDCKNCAISQWSVWLKTGVEFQ